MDKRAFLHAAVGAAALPLVLGAFDGYRVELPLAEVRQLGFIVATHRKSRQERLRR